MGSKNHHQKKKMQSIFKQTLAEFLKMKSKNHHQKKKDIFNALPKELQVEIFQKLPVKTLVCCICVCKSWNSIIKDSSFICNNLSKNNNKDHNPQLSFCFRHISDPFNRLLCGAHYICIHNQDLNAYKLINFPVKSQGEEFSVVNCINGLICLVGYGFKDLNPLYILWNPSIQRCIILPAPNLFSKSLGYVGFGYDSSTDDYKLVRMICPLHRQFWELAQVFSLNAGSWKTVDEEILPHCWNIQFPERQAVINGVIHWIARRNEDYVLLAFDVKDETFHEIRFPPEGLVGPLTHPVVYNDSTIGLFHTDGYNYNLWIMKGYGVTSSWSKVFSIATTPGSWLPFAAALGRIGEELLFPLSEGKIMAINLVNGKKIIRCSPLLKAEPYFTFIGTYKESLVLLNR